MSAIDSLTESSDSDDTMGNYPEKERDPSSIDFSFLKTGIKFRDIFRNLGSLYFFHFKGKSSKEGVLITRARKSPIFVLRRLTRLSGNLMKVDRLCEESTVV